MRAGYQARRFAAVHLTLSTFRTNASRRHAGNSAKAALKLGVRPCRSKAFHAFAFVSPSEQ
ncbi:hypothetical protein PCAR4_330037 [Paraburkholderia caribensis]|nr:hypothetical protein PCAR4_330037 [Paraburkholderia caribensis]